MAQLKGPGSMTDVNLVAVWYDNGVSKDKDGNVKSQFIDFQVDSRDPRGPGQTNLHLVSERQTRKDGTKGWNVNAGYAATSKDPERPSQLEAIKAAAGDNITKMPNGSTVATLKASVKPSTHVSGLVVSTDKPMGPSDHEVHPDIINDQFASVNAAKAVVEAKKEAAKEAAPVEAGVEAEAATEAVSTTKAPAKTKAKSKVKAATPVTADVESEQAAALEDDGPGLG